MQIVSGELQEGEILPIEDVASKEHSVSRTAYREAIKVLTAKGLVESRQRVGTRVRSRYDWNMLDPDVLRWATEIGPTTKFADTLFEFRIVVEPKAARFAAEKQILEHIAEIGEALEQMETIPAGTRENVDADLQFHNALLAASGNELLCSLHHMADSLLEWSFEKTSQAEGLREASIPLHRAVFERIEAGDAEGAEKAMINLIESARKDLDLIFDANGKRMET